MIRPPIAGIPRHRAVVRVEERLLCVYCGDETCVKYSRSPESVLSWPTKMTWVLSQTFHAMVPAQSYVMRRNTLNTRSSEYCVSKYSASLESCLGS